MRADTCNKASKWIKVNRRVNVKWLYFVYVSTRDVDGNSSAKWLAIDDLWRDTLSGRRNESNAACASSRRAGSAFRTPYLLKYYETWWFLRWTNFSSPAVNNSKAERVTVNKISMIHSIPWNKMTLCNCSLTPLSFVAKFYDRVVLNRGNPYDWSYGEKAFLANMGGLPSSSRTKERDLNLSE